MTANANRLDEEPTVTGWWGYGMEEVSEVLAWWQRENIILEHISSDPSLSEYGPDAAGLQNRLKERYGKAILEMKSELELQTGISFDTQFAANFDKLRLSLKKMNRREAAQAIQTCKNILNKSGYLERKYSIPLRDFTPNSEGISLFETEKAQRLQREDKRRRQDTWVKFTKYVVLGLLALPLMLAFGFLNRIKIKFGFPPISLAPKDQEEPPLPPQKIQTEKPQQLRKYVVEGADKTTGSIQYLETYAYSQEDAESRVQEKGVLTTHATLKSYRDKKKIKIRSGILGILLGSLGVHKFSLGYNAEGLIMLLLTIISIGLLAPVFGAIGIIEGCIYLTRKDELFYEKYIETKRAWF